MPFDGEFGRWPPERSVPPRRLPVWLPYAILLFGFVMGAVFGLQLSIAIALFCSLALSWPNALMTVPAPLFGPLALAGGCLGGCVAIWVVQVKSLGRWR